MTFSNVIQNFQLTLFKLNLREMDIFIITQQENGQEWTVANFFLGLN